MTYAKPPSAARGRWIVLPAAMLLGAIVSCATARPPQDKAPESPRKPDKSEKPDKPEDEAAEYVEYRYLPELGQITVADGVVRGPKSVASVKSHLRELAHKGIYPCVDRQRRHSYRRSDELEGHRFETVISITPPAGDDEEDDWERRVIVTVDGRKKVDCSIGQSPDGLFVYGVTIYPEDGTVEVAAVDDEGTELVPPVEFESLDDPGVITDDTLQPAPDDDEDDMAPKIERASGPLSPVQRLKSDI